MYACVRVGGQLLYLTGGGGGCLAADAGRVDRFGRDEVQVLIVWDLIQAVAVLEQLDVQVLIDLLEEESKTSEFHSFIRSNIWNSQPDVKHLEPK